MRDRTKFWNRIAARYSQKPVPSQEIYEEKLKKTRSLFTPQMDVLEIGCGTGTTSLIHAPYVKRIRATDFAAEMIEIARRKAEEKGIKNVVFVTESVEDMNYGGELFDVVMAHSILHLLRNRDLVLHNLFDVTKPGGFFVSSTVCVEEFSRLFKYIWPIVSATGLFPYVASFTADQLVGEIARCGFDIVHRWAPDTKTVFLIARKPE